MGIGSVGVGYWIKSPACATSGGFAICSAEQVLGNRGVVPWGVVEAAGNGGGVAVGGAVAVVETVPELC